MMTEKEAVKKALLISMEHELSCINSDLSGEPEPNFSHGFEEGMRRLINDQKSGAITPDKTTYISALSEHHSGEGVREYKTIKIGRRHFRRVFVIALAALLILAMTMIGIGIVRPGIYYKVIESIGSWDITPVHEGDQQKSVEDRYIEGAEAKKIHQILHTLREPYKEVFSLRALGELSFSDIGDLFGKSDSWARVTYHRARLMIMEEMKDE